MRRCSVALLLMTAALAAGVPSAAAQQRETTLSVTGRGQVEARPDRAELTYVVRRIAATREAARRSVATRTRSLFGRLRRVGVEQTGIRLSDVVVERRGGRRLRRPFVASGTVAARTATVSLAGRMLDLGPPLGADVSGPEYDLVDDGPARQEATRIATVDARRRADAVAQGLGMRVVAVQSVSIDGAEPEPALREDAATGAPSGPTTPTAPGTITVGASVTVVFVLAS